MDEKEPTPSQPRRRRRAVGPPDARPSADEPLTERADQPRDDRADLERYLAERPPHHEPR